ncbi:MAG TPA: hypothetical protein VEN81_08665 [Planctomycetota bacterium]|nr:hypothetical protein [Planctomycetota bacterium]
MGPRRQKFWFPLVRLGAFFGAVVVAGNVLLQGAFTPADAESDPEGRADYIRRSRRRLERQLKAIERLFFGREAGEDSGAAVLADPELQEVQSPGPIADAGRPATSLPVSLAASEPKMLLVAWPILPEPPSVRPPVERLSLELSLTPDLVDRFYRSGAGSPMGDVGDAFLRVPEAFLDSLLRCASRLLPRSEVVSANAEASGGMVGRIFDLQVGGSREGPICSEFVANWLDREERYFSRFGDSEFDTVGVENGTEDVDLRGLFRDQEKVLWDAARKTYFSKYRFRGDDRIQSDAFSVGQWRGADFILLPPLMAGYFWYRGLEKRISLGDSWMRVSFEPISRWVSGKADLVAGVSVEWGIKGIPVGLVVSGGKYEGRAGLDFVGIGTSVGMVRKVLENQRGDSSARSSGRAW